MHDVLVHYLEVNFPEIADQLAHARGRDPSNEERAAAAERLRELVRRLRPEAVQPAEQWHEPRASASELIAGVNGELSPDERKVLDHFFELFARSMERTRAGTPPTATAPASEETLVTETAPVTEAGAFVVTEEPAAEALPPEAEPPSPPAEPPSPAAEPPATPPEPYEAPEPEIPVTDEVSGEVASEAAPDTAPAAEAAPEPAPAE